MEATFEVTKQKYSQKTKDVCICKRGYFRPIEFAGSMRGNKRHRAFLYPSILATGEESVSLSSSFILRKNWYVGEETFIIRVREISHSERDGHSLTQNKIDEH